MKNQEERFTDIWFTEKSNMYLNNMGDWKHPSNALSDVDYILFSYWEQLNEERLYKEYFPNVTNVLSGSGSMSRKDQLIFHGGCQGCISQHLHGVDRCRGCSYFRFDSSKPDLTIESKEREKLTLRYKLEKQLKNIAK